MTWLRWPADVLHHSHFDGYAAVLVQLTKVTKSDLREAIVDGWLACAPIRLMERYLRPNTSATARNP